MVGARIVKTSFAIGLAILTAQTLHLQTPFFAGIVSVLAIQPSIYRSLRHGAQMLASALIGATIATITFLLVGNSFWVTALASLFTMWLLLEIRWTPWILVAIVILINTLASAGTPVIVAGLNQLTLVIIGIGYGVLINLLYKPKHDRKAMQLVELSEQMTRALLHYLHLELLKGRVPPYQHFRSQLDEVRDYIERGKHFSILYQEDHRYASRDSSSYHATLRTLESMVERIRDVIKSLQYVQLDEKNIKLLSRIIRLAIQMEEQLFLKKKPPVRMFASLLERVMLDLLIYKEDPNAPTMQQLDPRYLHSTVSLYSAYGFLLEFIHLATTNSKVTLPRTPLHQTPVNLPSFPPVQPA